MWESFEFLDLTVNSVPLREQLGCGSVLEECTPLSSGWNGAVTLAWLDQLSDCRGSEFTDQRVALLFCTVCGGVDCGAVSVRMERTGEWVWWGEFGWQNDYEAGYEPFAPGLNFTFNATEYDELVLSLRHEFGRPPAR